MESVNRVQIPAAAVIDLVLIPLLRFLWVVLSLKLCWYLETVWCLPSKLLLLLLMFNAVSLINVADLGQKSLAHSRKIFMDNIFLKFGNFCLTSDCVSPQRRLEYISLLSFKDKKLKSRNNPILCTFNKKHFHKNISKSTLTCFKDLLWSSNWDYGKLTCITEYIIFFFGS